MVTWSVIRCLPRKYPVLRGMISYAFIWPCCSLAQEYIEFGIPLSQADWPRAARFGVFGAFFMAPVFYGWMKYTQPLFPRKSRLTCIKRAAIEQVSYGPFALSYFLFGMTLMEGKNFTESLEETKAKFWPTYKVGFVFWPTVQTVNYCFIPQKNRIIFVSACSFVWTVYMAHVMSCRHKEDKKIDEEVVTPDALQILSQSKYEVSGVIGVCIGYDYGLTTRRLVSLPISLSKGNYRYYNIT